jgi:hypothetical protein
MMGRAAPLPRAWRIYAVSNFISQIGTWMQATAQAWLVLELTGSPELLGLLVAIQYFPQSSWRYRQGKWRIGGADEISC